MQKRTCIHRQTEKAIQIEPEKRRTDRHRQTTGRQRHRHADRQTESEK